MNNNSFLACHGSSIREMRFVLVIRHSPTLLAVCNQLVRVLLSVLRGCIRIRLGRIQDGHCDEKIMLPKSSSRIDNLQVWGLRIEAARCHYKGKLTKGSSLTDNLQVRGPRIGAGRCHYTSKLTSSREE